MSRISWVYDAFGKLAAEYSTETQTTPVGNYYRTTDHLGSTRLVTDDLGRVRQRHDFFPFGEQIPASASFGNRQDVIDGGFATYNASLSVRQQFTGQQRDNETGLDYFWARNMAAPLGRFLSMDPENAGANALIPHSWNAYSYVNDNPLRFVDPDGRSCEDAVGTCWVFVTDGVSPYGSSLAYYSGWESFCRETGGCDPYSMVGRACGNGGTHNGFNCEEPEPEPEPEPEDDKVMTGLCMADAGVGVLTGFIPGTKGIIVGAAAAAGMPITPFQTGYAIYTGSGDEGGGDSALGTALDVGGTVADGSEKYLNNTFNITDSDALNRTEEIIGRRSFDPASRTGRRLIRTRDVLNARRGVSTVIGSFGTGFALAAGVVDAVDCFTR